MRTLPSLASILLALLTACTPSPPLTSSSPSTSPPAPSVHSPCTTPVLRADTARRHQQILTEARQGQHQILFLGASIIERWTTVGKDPWTTTWLPRHALNAGISGDRTQHVIARLDDGLLEALAAPNNDIRWIVINIGSNNLSDDSAPDIAAGIEAILTRLRAKLPNAQIILTAILPWGEHPNPIRIKSARANQLVSDFIAASDPAPHHIHLLDIGARFLHPNGDMRTDLMPDFLHPTAAGYVFWSSELETFIK